MPGAFELAILAGIFFGMFALPLLVVIGAVVYLRRRDASNKTDHHPHQEQSELGQ